MAIEGQDQYMQVLVRLVPTRKPASQYLLSPQITGMGAPILARLSPAKAGHLSHGLHIYPITFLPFPTPMEKSLAFYRQIVASIGYRHDTRGGIRRRAERGFQRERASIGQ
jgi:hypothetical protein